MKNKEEAKKFFILIASVCGPLWLNYYLQTNEILNEYFKNSLIVVLIFLMMLFLISEFMEEKKDEVQKKAIKEDSQKFKEIVTNDTAKAKLDTNLREYNFRIPLLFILMLYILMLCNALDALGFNISNCQLILCFATFTFTYVQSKSGGKS